MKLAESKRNFILNEFWISAAIVGVGDFGTDTYIANAFPPLTLGADDYQLVGNQIIDPMVTLQITVAVRWAQLNTQWSPYVPSVKASMYLVAINDQIATTAPRITSVAEDNALFMTHPGRSMRWTFNSQNVTVIKKKTLLFSPKSVSVSSVASTAEIKTMKIAKRLRGTKEFEQTITAGGIMTTTPFLKGWNYYWIVVTQVSAGLTVASTAAANPNPVEVSGDRFLYFKDF